MLGTLVQIAKEMVDYEANQKGVDQKIVELNRLCQDPRKGEAEVKVLAVYITKLNVRLEDYKDEERYKYLLAGLSKEEGNKPIGPSWILDIPKKEKLNKDKIENTIKGIKSALENLSKDLDKDEKGLVQKYLDILGEEEKRVKIIKNIGVKADANPNTRLLVTVQLDGKKRGEIGNIAKGVVKKRLFGGRRAESCGNASCAMCGKETVVRASLPFGDFFTIEKTSFAPMALEEDVWKYASLCEDCTKWLYIAKDYLNSRLSTRVAGKWAYVIPTLEPGASKIKEQFIQWLWELGEDTRAKGKKVKPVSKELERFPEKWEDPGFLGGLMEWSEFSLPPFRSASLIFYEKDGHKFKFLYTILDVLPRQLRVISKSLKKAREILRKGILGDADSNLIKKLNPTFEFVGDAWKWPGKYQEPTQGKLKLTPMHLVESILLHKSPKKSVFWSDTDNILRALYSETISGDGSRRIRQVVSERIVLFWVLWTLIYSKIGGESMTEKAENIVGKARELSDEFWERFFAPRIILDSDAKKAMFLIGVLFGRVESIQRDERRSKSGEMPIVGRLRGFSISAKEISQKLFQELLIKLRQLASQKFPFSRSSREIVQAAADYLSRAESILDEEARFCFCLGWSLEWTTFNAVKEALGFQDEEETNEEAEEEEIKEGGA